MAIKTINNFFRLFGVELKKTRALEVAKEHYSSIIAGGTAIFQVHKKSKDKILNQELSGLVFSRDRTMQLHALLTSYIQQVKNFCQLSILYKATDEGSKQSYEVLKKEFEDFPFRFIEETAFAEQVIAWLRQQSADRIFFMTDDAVFLDSFDMNDLLLFNPLDEIFSLTKGKDLQYCFTMDVKQALPFFDTLITKGGISFNAWKWGNYPSSPDWTYPLSVDGTFFMREEILCIAEHITFKTPNSLEANMQLFIDFFLQRKGICYDKVKMINVPCNLVQNEFNNRSTGFFKIEQLQALWQEGKRIDVKMFYGLDAYSAEHARYNFVSKIN